MPTTATGLGERDAGTSERDTLCARYKHVRGETESLCASLAVEDYCIQSMPDVSPPKWHLAHTAWFFETFLLRALLPDYRPFHRSYEYLFNSYYESEGTPYPRHRRGLLSRPTVDEIYRYRGHVNQAMEALIGRCPAHAWAGVSARTTLGLHHEQQHQELLLTDIKHNFAINPLRPAYRRARQIDSAAPGSVQWRHYNGGIAALGHEGDDFAFDNETPKHRVWLADFSLASRLVTNSEYLAFMDDGGYQRPELWLADGWQSVKEHRWNSPLYWERIEDQWWHMTLTGMQPLPAHTPVCHVSYYEADAYARWARHRLPTEAEWERAAGDHAIEGNFRESDWLAPVAAAGGSVPAQLYGDVWEWTASPYSAYPGYRPPAGALGEYNGKFMCNQMVLRGGSCVSPRSHLRTTYRNFFFPDRRWQFSGIRLAEDR